VGCLSNSFRLSDGYFILLDRLKDTLEERIGRWKKTTSKGAPPGLTQIKAATCIADALVHLHSKRIVFRDLKPANVGFDNAGVLKLFDFGFAIGVDEPHRGSSICSSEDEDESHLLYDKCGTPRYMAPEVGLMTGYDMAADVYSFGILLWEMCALKKPFGKVRSAAEFDKTVFERGARPKLNKRWPVDLQEVMTSCWSSFPAERPEMSVVKSLLAGHARHLSQQRQNGNGRGSSLRNSLTFRRFTQ
jgi:serine/threonine protein kinase